MLTLGSVAITQIVKVEVAVKTAKKVDHVVGHITISDNDSLADARKMIKASLDTSDAPETSAGISIPTKYRFLCGKKCCSLPNERKKKVSQYLPRLVIVKMEKQRKGKKPMQAKKKVKAKKNGGLRKRGNAVKTATKTVTFAVDDQDGHGEQHAEAGDAVTEGDLASGEATVDEADAATVAVLSKPKKQLYVTATFLPSYHIPRIPCS